MPAHPKHVSGKKLTLEEQVFALLSAGETLDRVAMKLDQPLPKVRSIAATHPIESYDLLVGEHGGAGAFIFLDSSDGMNELLDWNKPIFWINDQFIAQQCDGQWFGFDLASVCASLGFNFGNLQNEFLHHHRLLQ